jgi:hypothetical protein
MSDTIRVWPKDGLTIKDPITQQRIEPGQEVSLTRYIERRIAEGDLSREDPAKSGDKEHGVVSTRDEPELGDPQQSERV